MLSKELEILNKLGLHARAAAKVVAIASRYESRITFIRNGQKVDAKSIMGLLMLGAAQGSRLDVEVEGTDEADALREIEDLFNRRFDEAE